MRIKSKFKDYYDGVNPNFVEEPVYVRNTYCHTVDRSVGTVAHFNIQNGGPQNRFGPDVVKLLEKLGQAQPRLVNNQDPAILYFCGRTYVAYTASPVLPGEHASTGVGSMWTRNRFFWKDCIELRDVIKAKQKARELDRDLDVGAYLEHTFKEQGHKDNEIYDLQLQAQIPVVLDVGPYRYARNLIENPILRVIDFPKIMDAQQAWQELSMFWGNVVMPERAMVTISDKDRHQQHGFDKHSFRRTSKELKGE